MTPLLTNTHPLIACSSPTCECSSLVIVSIHVALRSWLVGITSSRFLPARPDWTWLR